MSLVIGIVGFVVLIVVVVGVHELGHFAVAKASGIRVDEFAIGFGPRLLSRRRGETVYSLRALPLGGFVRMPGMSALEEDDGGPRGFMRAPFPAQVLVLLAGVTMNLVLAGVLFGVVRTQGQQAAATAGLPAALAGLGAGDEVTAIDGRPLDTSNATAVATALHGVTDGGRGAPVTVTYRRSGGGTATATLKPALVLIDEDDSQPLTTAAGTAVSAVVVDAVEGTVPATGDPAALLGSRRTVSIVGHAYGASPGDAAARVAATVHDATDGRAALGELRAAWYIGYQPATPGESLPVALVNGVRSIPSVVGDTVRNIWAVITTPNSGGVKNFQGPVGIAHDTVTATQSGVFTYVGFIGLISLSLAIVNVLPIPPFDGGRVVLVIRQALSRRRESGARLEMALVAAGALLIGTLAILITINDVKGF